MTGSFFCADCGSEKDRAYSSHCDSCNKLVQTGTVGARCRSVDDVNHATVEVVVDHFRLVVCADCIHKLGQPFIARLIEMGTRQLHHPSGGGAVDTEIVLTPLAVELRRLEEQSSVLVERQNDERAKTR